MTTTKPTREELIALWAENMKAFTAYRAAKEKYEQASRAYWEKWTIADEFQKCGESLCVDAITCHDCGRCGPHCVCRRSQESRNK